MLPAAQAGADADATERESRAFRTNPRTLDRIRKPYDEPHAMMQLLANLLLAAVAPATMAPATMAPATASPATGAQSDVSQAPAWRIMPGASRLRFTATYDEVPFHGRFERFRGKIRFAPDRLDASRFEVQVDVTSVNTQSSERDTALANERWFDFERYPEARFVAKRFERLDNGAFRAHARLGIKDATRDVALTFRWRRDGDRARLTGETKLSRTAFRIGEGEWADAETIGDEVTVSVDVHLKRAGGGESINGEG